MTLPADNIYYVDLSDDSTFATIDASVYPEKLQFDHQIRGVGNISFQLSYSALDKDGNLAVPSKDFIGPWRSYWRLRCGNITITAGVITKTNAKYGEDFMSIFGVTWEGVIARWMYPFDPRGDIGLPTDPVNTYVFEKAFQGNEIVPSGMQTAQYDVYQCYNRDVILVWSDIFGITMQGVPHRVQFDISEIDNPAFLSGNKTSMDLPLGDTSTMDSFITGLSQIGDGFDWWISWDKVMKWGSPYRFGAPGSAFLFDTLTSNDALSGFLRELEFSNNGPRATHVLGSGAGLASGTTLYRAYGETTNQVMFSRFDQYYDLGEVKNKTQLEKKTRRQLSLDLNPEHEIPITLDPAMYGGGVMQYWADYRVGRAIWITLDVGYHLIDSAQQLKSFNASVSEEGNAEVQWTINQIYDTSTSAGTPEG